MEVQLVWQVGVASECGRLVWSRATSPAQCVQQDGLQGIHRLLCDLGRMQRALNIGCDHSTHLEVKEPSPL